MSSSKPRSARTNTFTDRHNEGRVANALIGEIAVANASGVVHPSNLARQSSSPAGHVIDADAITGPWAVLTSQPFTGVAVHEHSGHLLIDLQSTRGNVRMQLTQRELPVVLKSFIDAVAQLAAVAE